MIKVSVTIVQDQSVLQDQTKVSSYLVQMLPYVATLVALPLLAGKRSYEGRAPAGLGKHPD